MKRTELKRSSKPLARKRKPRAYKTPRCIRGRCTKPARVLDLCRSHAQAECDRLFSLYVRARDERCCNCGSTEYLQCAHVVSRRYQVVRHNPRNAFALCRSCHTYQTHHPIEGEAMFNRFVGRGVISGDVVGEMKFLALHNPVPDLADVLTDLRTKVAA